MTNAVRWLSDLLFCLYGSFLYVVSREGTGDFRICRLCLCREVAQVLDETWNISQNPSGQLSWWRK
jgi:hypothetical protein